MSNLVNHAKEELERLGNDSDFNDGIIRIVQAFADMGHSGGSASYATPLINNLLQFKNLTPLTDDPSEWMHVGDDMWQNRRNSEAFSNDRGVTHWILSEGANSSNPWPRHVSRPRDVSEKGTDG